MRSAIVAVCLLAGCGSTHRSLERGMTQMSELELTWAYDPSSGLLAVARESGAPGITLVDTRNDRATRELHAAVPWPRRMAISPNGRWLTYHELNPRDLSWEKRLYLHDIASDTSRLIVDCGHDDVVPGAVFTPDGNQLAYELVSHRGDKWLTAVRIRDLASGSERSLLPESSTTPARAPVFSADGKQLFVLSGNCVRRIELADGKSDTLCVAGTSTFDDYRDPPTVSSDAQSVAFTVDTAECPRIAVADFRNQRASLVAPDECGMRPTWLHGGADRIAFIGLPLNGSRVPRVQALTETRSRGFGFERGVTYQLAAEPSGTTLALVSTPDRPRAVWRFDPASARAEKVYSPVKDDLYDALRNAASSVTAARARSRDGLEVPIEVFAARDGGTQKHPAVLWIHGGTRGKEDIAPRWTQEIEYLTARGFVVAAVNYRGSTGFGNRYRDRADDQAGQIEDVRAALAYLRTLPEVDARRIALLAVCYGGTLAAPIASEKPNGVRAVIQFQATAQHWLTSGLRVPLLWLSGRDEPGAATHPAISARLHHSGIDVQWLELPAGHAFLAATDRAAALDAVGRFLSVHLDKDGQP